MNAREIVYDVFDDHLCIDAPKPHQTLGDLGLDSLDQVELLMGLEEHVGELGPEGFTFNGATTVREIIDLVAEALNGNED